MSPGRLDRVRASLKPRPRRPATPAAPAPAPVPGPIPAELDARRSRLEREYADLQSDLGGLVYEMAIRDAYRLDVITRQAARLQAVDAQLTEVERAINALNQRPAAVPPPPPPSPAVPAPPAPAGPAQPAAPAPPAGAVQTPSSDAPTAAMPTAATGTCAACGRPLEPGAGFCGSCGTPVASALPPGAQPAGP